jgi:glyoxylase I family protein
MIKQLAHVCIATDNLDDTIKFYRDGLGFKKVFEFIKGARVVGFYLGVPGGTYVEVFLRGDFQRDARAPIQHLCFQVDDVNATSEHLKALGYAVTPRKLGADQSWQAWITDPSGVRIEMHQYTEKSSQLTGTACLLD